jgi:hypothetical protein
MEIFSEFREDFVGEGDPLSSGPGSGPDPCRERYVLLNAEAPEDFALFGRKPDSKMRNLVRSRPDDRFSLPENFVARRVQLTHQATQ